MAQTIGKQLQHIRESQGLSLEELSKLTHIKVPYLRALEEGDVEALPSQAHLRGFLRLYATTLDVDLDKLIPSAVQTDGQEKPLEEIPEPEPREEAQEEKEPAATEQEETSREPRKLAALIEKTKLQITGFFTKLFKFKKPEAKTETAEPSVETSPAEPVDSRSSEEIFSDIGERLQHRRNLISLSLDDVESQTHIRKHFLAAIESGQFDKLPSPVQARGMLANFAGFLSLDVDTILLDYAEGLQKKRLESITPSPQKKSVQEISSTRLRLKNFFSLDLLVIAAIFIIFAGFVIWGINRILSADSTSISATDLPDVSDVLLATATPTPEFIETVEQTQSVEVTEGETIVDTTEISTSIPNTSAITIVVIPIQNAWIQVTSDGEITYQGRVLTGNAYEYYADSNLELLTGSAGALQVYFNEQDVGSLGLVGQVSSLVFTTSGLVMPTATASPIPTITPQESTTPSITPTTSPTEP